MYNPLAALQKMCDNVGEPTQLGAVETTPASSGTAQNPERRLERTISSQIEPVSEQVFGDGIASVARKRKGQVYDDVDQEIQNDFMQNNDQQMVDQQFIPATVNNTDNESMSVRTEIFTIFGHLNGIARSLCHVMRLIFNRIKRYATRQLN